MVSTISAIVYMLLPYLGGVVLYDRMAVGELAAFVWMPMLLALCDRANTGRIGTLSAISVAFALLLMSNILQPFYCSGAASIRSCLRTARRFLGSLCSHLRNLSGGCSPVACFHLSGVIYSNCYHRTSLLGRIRPQFVVCEFKRIALLRVAIAVIVTYCACVPREYNEVPSNAGKSNLFRRHGIRIYPGSFSPTAHCLVPQIDLLVNPAFVEILVRRAGDHVNRSNVSSCASDVVKPSSPKLLGRVGGEHKQQLLHGRF